MKSIKMPLSLKGPTTGSIQLLDRMLSKQESEVGATRWAGPKMGGHIAATSELTQFRFCNALGRRPSFPALILQPAPKAACADKAYQRQTKRVRAEVDQHLHARHGCRAEKHRSNDPIEGAGFLNHLPLRHMV